jgi:succinoglycan biosynthesis protein ExoV
MTGIAETEVIITEAMHGAIIADAFRIPWIPVRTHQEILDFKWKDWTSSVCVEYKPKSIVPLFDLEDELAREKRARSWIKQKIAAVQLSSIARFARTTLSNEKRLDYLLSSLERKLETFKRDVAEGKFQPRSRE